MQKKSTIILTLAPFIFAFAFALDIYVPSIPSIKIYFSASTATVQLTISLFLLLTGAGQLVAGPISDSIGRKKVILYGALFFLLGSIMAAISSNMFFLITARMIQGIGGASMMVASFAMVRDLFAGDECAAIYSLLNGGIALSPLTAPIIGGYLAKWYGWRSSFLFLAVMAAAIVILAQTRVKESLPAHKRTRLTKSVFNDYLLILRNNKFKKYAFCASAGFACFLTFFSVSSYVLITLLGVAEQHFGFYFAFIGVIFFIGSLISSASSKKIGTYYTVLIGALLTTSGGICMLVWYLSTGLTIMSFIGPMLIMGIGGAMLMGGGAGGAIEPFPEKAGAAAAVFGCCEFLFAFIVSTIVMGWKVTSTLPLSITLIILGGACALACLLCKSRQQTT